MLRVFLSKASVAALVPSGLLAASLFCASAAHADSTSPASGESATPSNGAAPGQATSTPAAGGSSQNTNLFGDLGGLRPALAKIGVTLSLQEQSEILGNLSGGRRQGFDYDGLTTGTLQLDTQPAFGWAGGLFNVSGLQIHGRNLSTDNLRTLQFASGIEADRATRLWELWYQQKLFDDKADVKIGQQSLDQEFMVSQNSNYFINAAMGWPILPTENMPGGGPAYPLSALGVRGRVHLTDSLTILGGIFNGSPVANNTGDPQMRNPSGTSFPLNGGVLAIAELQYAVGSPDPSAKGADTNSLPGTYKVGFWYDSEKFDDLRFDNSGLPLASPASTGVAARHGGDYGFYGVVDQMLYRFQDDSGHNLNVFVRPMFTPLDDRNLISYAVDGGVTLHEPFAGRSDDVAGLGFGYARVSAAASGFDQDKAFFNPGVYTPVRHSETFIEATYQYQATPWWQIQPDFQYVFNPGAGVLNPNVPTQKVRNEAVVGVRTNITF